MTAKILTVPVFLIISFFSFSQTCDEYISWVKSKGYGSTYYSYNSEAISKVTFYDIQVDYEYFYFAIVCFKNDYYGCDEYIYQVASGTKYSYSLNYLNSAGKAFWNYINPYNSNLGCAPEFE